MKRVLVIGCGGAGKTTLSRQLSVLTGLPVIHLDRYFWKRGWIAEERNLWKDKVLELAQAEEWIMDGNYGGTLEIRYKYCDTILFLDTSRWHCLWNVLKRRVIYSGRNRGELPAGCNERLNGSFIAWIWAYRKRKRPDILARLAELRSDKRVEILRTYEEIAFFMQGVVRTQ